MCWRRVTKSQKTVFTVLFYFAVYVLISYAVAPESKFAFVGDELRVGDKYALIFLQRPRSPVYSDAEGAQVFESRRCGKCFLTNNKGFLPLSEYDAILVHGGRKVLADGDAAMYPEKRYLIETSGRCIMSKLQMCRWEPKITSFSTRDTYNLCSLCDHLHKRRSKADRSKNLHL